MKPIRNGGSLSHLSQTKSGWNGILTSTISAKSPLWMFLFSSFLSYHRFKLLSSHESVSGVQISRLKNSNRQRPVPVGGHGWDTDVIILINTTLVTSSWKTRALFTPLVYV